MRGEPRDLSNMATASDVREYRVEARSTDTFGRVLCSARDQHFVVDGPVQNGCPGEALTPAEIFLAGVAACGVELLGVIARDTRVPLRSVRASAHGVLDRSRPVRSDVSLFNAVHLVLSLEGVSQAEAEELVATFKRR
jgi:uncharacterized OsmC-like protein